jgi:hypothetical protein
VDARIARVAIIAVLLLTVMQDGSASALGLDPVISQVYGGGGASAPTFKWDYVELHNPSYFSVSVEGWSVQYTSATGSNPYQVTPLHGTIPAGGYLLVREGAAGSSGAELPVTPEVVGSIEMSETAGKVALVSRTDTLLWWDHSHLVDLVGYGGASDFEGSGPAPAISETLAALRLDGGNQDTTDNSADFVALAPQPRNGAAAPHMHPMPATTLLVSPPPNGLDGWYIEPPPEVLLVRDMAGATHFRWDTTSTYTVDPATTTTVGQPLLPGGGLAQGAHALFYFGVSSLGVTEAPVNVATIKYDGRDPVGDFTINGGAATTTRTLVTIESTATDSESGMGHMQIGVDGSFAATIPYAPKTTATLPDVPDLHAVTVRYWDLAGNMDPLPRTHPITLVSQAAVTPVAPPAPAPSAITIQSDRASVARGASFQLTGVLSAGRLLDPCVVWVRKPGARRWSYSSARLTYRTHAGDTADWWYRYGTRGVKRGLYAFKVSFAGDAQRQPCVSSRIVYVTVR